MVLTPRIPTVLLEEGDVAVEVLSQTWGGSVQPHSSPLS